MTRGARISPTPRRTTCDTPPARVSPTRCVAWGPGAVGIHTTDATNYCDSFHSWAVGIKPPFAEASGDEPPRPNHPRKLHFRGARYRGTPPLDEELVTFPLRAEFPSIGGVGDTGPRAMCRVGPRGRWAFIRPTRRIIVILSTLGRWGLVTSYS